MSKKATSPFKLDSFDHSTYDEAEGAKLGRARITKTFTGEVEGTSVVEMLSAHNASGPAAYVALERVNARVHGRAGSFVFQHWGGMGADGGQELRLGVVSGTGTGELEGITGTANIHIDAQGNHTLELDYDLP
ncbi:MAG TPA: DUF3224 domain-containing protein [Kofleriaceae bacterium]|nr:DUF3224 domain-containing protein [Kofleriaceae bacterium]